MSSTQTTITPAELHGQAMRASIQEATNLLRDLLSQQLVAFVVGKDAKTVQRWAKGESTQIRDTEAERRLRATYEIALLLLQHDSSRTVKAWFISMNPQLGDSSPVEAIQEGQFGEAFAAARAFVVGG